MAIQDQLEIISPSGQIEFHNLDPTKGVTNIGRHADNDVIIDAPQVAPFQAVLDHRQKPYRIMVLTDEGEATLDGEPLAPNDFKEMHYWGTFQIDGYAIILLEGVAVPEAVATHPPPVAVPAVVPVSPVPLEEAEAPAAPRRMAGLQSVPPDQTDEWIVVEMPDREWTIDVEQTATYQLTLVNGGSVVATFEISVEGVDPSWVTISPPAINLYEGARATVQIHLAPPRAPTSRAGRHPLAVTVTSPNYPGHMSRLGAVLIVNPYHEFTVGELTPKEQTIRRIGHVTFPISNKGNSETPFRLDGEDDERRLRFEFEVPGEEVALVRQAEMRLAPDTSYLVPVQITPVRRPFISLRSRRHSFTITASMVEGLQTPRSVMGRVKVTPVIGPILLLLILLCLVALTLFFFSPAKEPALTLDTNMPQHEEPVTMAYNAARFPNLSPTHLLNHQNAFFLRLTLEFKPAEADWQILKAPSELEKPVGSTTDVPLENGRYRLRVDNWISGLLPMFRGLSREAPVYVTPVEPDIQEFRADKDPIWGGEEVTLFWRVEGADSLRLEYNGIEESFQEAELQSGQRKFTPEANTTYTLIASNRSWPDEIRRPLQVNVLYPTATPVPTPVVVRFDVDPLEITVGETVRIDWEVAGADAVDIEPLEQGLPPKGNIGAQPESLTTYQMIAYLTAPDGSRVQSAPQLREVIVNPEPSATPEPVAPEVELFESTPKEVILGDDETVKLTWSVSGKTTDIEITAPNFQVTGLKEKDVISVTLKETTIFVLTAYNGELARSAAVEVVALEPTPTPTEPPPPTPPPPPTATPTPFPPPIIAFYKAEGREGFETMVSFRESYESDNGPVYVYAVEAGALAKLRWEVNGADAVTIEGFGPQPATGELPIPEAVTSPASYILTAVNNEGQNQIAAYIRFELVSPPPPPPPHSVSGLENSVEGTNAIAWSYASRDRDKIDYFRIYRADVPPGTNFALVWPTEDSQAGSWVDVLGPGKTCGKAYYVVAVYTDLVTGAEKETAASDTSWYSQPCSSP